jgi:hypothetical protein
MKISILFFSLICLFGCIQESGVEGTGKSNSGAPQSFDLVSYPPEKLYPITEFTHGYDFAVDSSKNLYYVTAHSSIKKYDSDRLLLNVFTITNDDGGGSTKKICVNDSQEMFVLHWPNGLVQKYSSVGEVIWEYPLDPAKENGFRNDLSCDFDEVFLSNSDETVSVLSSEGVLVRSFIAQGNRFVKETQEGDVYWVSGLELFISDRMGEIKERRIIPLTLEDYSPIHDLAIDGAGLIYAVKSAPADSNGARALILNVIDENDQILIHLDIDNNLGGMGGKVQVHGDDIYLGIQNNIGVIPAFF